MQELKFYQNQIPPMDVSLLQRDAVSFSVLISVLQQPCAATLTDHRNIVLCWSQPPYPVWVWLRDLTREEDILCIASSLREYFPLERGFSWNMEQALFEKLQNLDGYFSHARIKMALLSYRLDQPPSPGRACGGTMMRADHSQLEQMAELWKGMTAEMSGFSPDTDHCRDRVKELLDHGGLFFWRTSDGRLSALAARQDQSLYSKISGVYTLPQFRRQGYARNLVSAVASAIRSDGLIPVLYTDGGYLPSNACYRKIGFRQIGQLCTVIKKDLP